MVYGIHWIGRLRIGLRIDIRIWGVGRWGGLGGFISFFVSFFSFSFTKVNSMREAAVNKSHAFAG